MKNYLPIRTATVMALLFAAPLQSMAGHWYLGGTLTNATVPEWHISPYENKLATAASWTMLQPTIRKISLRSSSMETVRPYAIELVACINEISAMEFYADKNVSNLAAACIFSMGW